MGWMRGWMACDFTSFSTVFQDDGRLIMKGNETPFTVEKISPRAWIELGPLD